jgi:hypothetical protein
MKERADLIAILNPRLTEAQIIVSVEKLFGSPLYPQCGKPLVKDENKRFRNTTSTDVSPAEGKWLSTPHSR